MKIISKIALIFILGGIVFLNSTCTKEKWFSTLTYEGYVYDTLGGRPVSGVWVTLLACYPISHNDDCQEYTVGQSKTDASGHFYIHSKKARSNRYGIRVPGSNLYSGFLNTSSSQLNNNYWKTLYLK